MNNGIGSNILSVQQRMRRACERVHRSPDEVRLLLATKTVCAEHIRRAFQTGVTLIAENRVQELRKKFYALRHTVHTNHFIGHLQTNKIKDILKYNVTCIHSLDRLSLAEKLFDRLREENRNIDVLVQVNTSEEKSKFGVMPDEVLGFLKEVALMENLNVKGLMTLGLFSNDLTKVRACFRLLREVQQEVAAANIPGVVMRELSMGMTGDFEIAIEEGATIIRVGSAVFGQRRTPDSYYWNEDL